MSEQGKMITIAVLFVTAVLLLCTLVIIDRIPASQALATGAPDRGGDYIMLAGGSGGAVAANELVYVIDGAAKQMRVYRFSGNRIEMPYRYDLADLAKLR